MTDDTSIIHVLDHGFVRLVDHMGDDLSIVRNARQSFDAAWRAGEDHGSDKRLINYLWKNRHTTPFESVEFQFEVHAPIFVFRQWHRHRTWSYNELSARYSELPEDFYIPATDQIGVQSEDNKQGRVVKPLEDMTPFARGEADGIRQYMRARNERSFNAYRQLLEVGVPRELARSVLPVATYSNMFAKVDLLNLLKFLDLRMDPHAQYEIRVYAEAMLKLIEPHVPVTIAAWHENKRQLEAQACAYRVMSLPATPVRKRWWHFHALRIWYKRMLRG